MTYSLGIDLGTTYTAAAVYEDGRTSIVDLSSRTATIPSIVFLAEDGTFLVGDAAVRRSLAEPARAARQFKRRFGDTTPIFLGGTPMSADQLSAQLLKAVVADVARLQGAEPQHITITHPANWGGYKLELLEQSIRAAGLSGVETITEPEAAVLHYAALERVAPGSLVAVFDLGGGTFDAAIVRKTEQGTEFLGRPEGIERLGGIDFDQAVFAFVAEHLDGAIENLDVDVPANRNGLERLRADCVEAKEALSADEVVDIAVMLPTVQTSVRMTRSEFESLVRPALAQAIASLHRALASADLDPAALDAVLLAGGSSRIPLVAEMVGGELGRPVAVDAHPKQVVALGAALAAGTSNAGAPTAASGGATETDSVVSEPTVAIPVALAAGLGSEPPSVTPDSAPRPRRRALVVGGAVALIAAVAGAIFLFGGGSDDGGGVAADTTVAPTDSQPDVTTAAPATAAPLTAAPLVTAPDATAAPETTDAVAPPVELPFPADTPHAVLTSVDLVGTQYEVRYDTINFVPSFEAGELHLHFFWNTEAPESVGTSSSPQGQWIVWALRADNEPVFDQFGIGDVPAGATAVCAVVATAEHAIDHPEYVADTVSCIEI